MITALTAQKSVSQSNCERLSHMPNRLQQFSALAWLTAIMLSPEALGLQGNIAGASGGRIFWLLTAVVGLHGLNIVTSSWTDEVGHLRSAFGAWGASILMLAARPAVAILMATATLVTAGFVFNEIFVYWFPNFGFAALLLASVLALNLAGRRITALAQSLFFLTTLTGLAVLTVIGLAGAGGSAPNEPLTAFGSGLQTIGLAAVAFIGYDLLRYTSPGLDHRRARTLVFIGLASAGLFFWAWNTAALTHVGASRLADTSIPHILAAKAIMGPSGRLVIGVVVIAGACAAVNFLFQAVAQMMTILAERGLMPAIAGLSPSRPWLPLVTMTGVTGLLMAVGFAGSDWLDTSLRAGLIIWITSIGLSHLPSLFPGTRRDKGPVPLGAAAGSIVHLALLVAMVSTGVILVWTDETPVLLLRAILVLITIAAGLAAAGLLAARRPFSRRRKASHPKEGVSQ